MSTRNSEGSVRGKLVRRTEKLLMLHVQDDEPEYPSSDGKPMAESDLHRQRMVDLIEALSQHFMGQEVYVSGNLLLYYERGNPKACLSPDVLVTLDRSPHPRETYKLWEEGKAPELVIEVTSRTTRKKDTHHKKNLYECLGVQEYLLFDPRGDYLEPRFQVYRRSGSRFLPVLTPTTTGYTSPSLNLNFRVVDEQLRVFDRERLLPTPAEQAKWAREESARAEREAARAEREAARAEREAARAQEAEAELSRLRALLQQQGQEQSD